MIVVVEQLAEARATLSEAMLTTIEELVVFNKFDKVTANNFLKYFDDVRGQCNWPVVYCQALMASFVDWDNIAQLEFCWIYKEYRAVC